LKNQLSALLCLGWRTNLFERDADRRIANQPAIDQRFRIYYGKLNALLEEEDGDFLNGDKLTHADFWIASFVHIWNNPLTGAAPVMPPMLGTLDDSKIYVDLVNEFPALKKHQEKVHAIPQIQKWVSARPKTYC